MKQGGFSRGRVALDDGMAIVSGSEAGRLGPRVEDERLVAFLSARAGEDEAAARAATPGPWRWGDWSATFGTPELERDTLERSPEHGPFPAPVRLRGVESDAVLRLQDSLEIDPDQEASALHIALHDPARVLREVAAKRRRLEDYRQAARACRSARPGQGPPLLAYRDACYRAVLADAAIWDGHPDYEHRWKM